MKVTQNTETSKSLDAEAHADQLDDHAMIDLAIAELLRRGYIGVSVNAVGDVMYRSIRPYRAHKAEAECPIA